MIANGSFNWTRQAVLFNQENVVLSDNPALVSPIYGNTRYFSHSTASPLQQLSSDGAFYSGDVRYDAFLYAVPRCRIAVMRCVLTAALLLLLRGC
jgi:hypothetical protein